MENVRSWKGEAAAASPLVIVESRPPLTYEPTGTSARMRSATDDLSRESSRSTASAGSASPAPYSGSQYRRVTSEPSRQSAQHPGGSWKTPANTVRGARADQKVKTSSSPTRSGSAATSPLANRALASD